MWRLVLIVGLWNTITTQPVTDDSESSRQPRQLDFRECCPCPVAGRGPSLDAMVRSAGLDDVTRASAVDDCPCRVRPHDAEGAPSIFLPRAVHPLWSDMRPDQSKDDPKPLLHPEVDFASSVLETLRDATDEEYQEALAREAARNAARVSELRDVEPDTAKVVTIIVNPQEDDAMPEASHAHETRCLHPLSTPHLGQVRESEHKTPTFKLKPNLLHRKVDMDSGASNVQENVVSLNKGLEGLRLKTTPDILKLLSTKKSARDGNIQSLLNLRKDKKLPKEAEDVSRSNNAGFKLPNLKLHSLIKDNADSTIKPLNLGLDKFKFPKIKITQARKPILSNTENLDSNLSPSVVQEQVAENTNDHPQFELKSLLPDTKTPFSLKNLLNLKDVELIGPNSSKTKITLPDFKLLPPLRVNKPDTTFTKQRKPIGAKAKKNCDKSKEKMNTMTSRKQNVKTEILDALPNPSENHEVIATAESNTDISAAELDTDSQTAQQSTVDRNPVTHILDAVPNGFEHNGMLSLDEDELKSTTPVTENTILDGNTNSDGNANSQISGAENTSSKLSTDNLKNSDRNDDGVGLVIDGDENIEFEELEIKEQSDIPISEIDISAIDEENLEIGLENGDDSESEIDTISLNADDVDSIVIDDEPQFELQQEDLVDTEDINNSQFFKIQSDINQEEGQDADAETSNQFFQITSIENVEERADDFVQKDDLQSAEIPRNGEENTNLSSMEKVLPSVKERISLTLKTLKNPNAKVLSITRFNRPEAVEDAVEENNRGSLNSEETVDTDTLSEDTEKFPLTEKSVEDKKELNKLDLQIMSNTLLRSSNSKKLPLGDFEDISLSELNQTDSFTNFNKNDNASNQGKEKVNSDMDSSATTNTEVITSSKSIEDLSEARKRFDVTNLHEDEIAESTCAVETESAKTTSEEQIERDISDPARINTQGNEMASEASESLFNVVPNTGSSVLRQNIVQPSSFLEPPSLFDVNNLLPPVPSLDITNLQVPTLSDITSGISSLFSGNVRAAEDVELTSTEFVSAEDCSNTNPVMATDASTTNLRSSFAPLKPLEDINLDIFQINPFQSSPFAPKIPSLNLNTFRTKLAVPKSLGLKPMKLQSALERKNGGLLGATLSFGPDTLGSASKAKPVLKLNSILDRQGADILGNSLASMPSLEDLRAAMRANTQSLLSSPLVRKINSQTLGDSLRSHTENQMRNLQQTLASTLNEAQVSNLNKAEGKFAKPQNILEMVSTAHEDMNDKLQAIHIDLKDRLETIHDHIKDHTNLPTLRSPLLSIPSRSVVEEVDDSPGRWKIKGEKKSSLLRSTQTQKKTVAIKKSSSRVNTPATQNKVKLGSTSVNSQTKLRPFKMSKAASSLTPKTVEVPKLKTTPSKPPFSRPLQRDNNVRLKESRPLFGIEEITLKPVARKQIMQITDFRATPRPTTFRSGLPKTKSLLKSEQTNRFRNSRPTGQFKSFGDAMGFASEPKPTQIPAPVKTIFKTSALPRDKPALKSASLSPLASRTSPGKSSVSLTPTKSLAQPSLLKSTEGVSFFKGIPKFESLLKPTESSLLSKKRDPIWIRLSSRPIKSADAVTPATHKTIHSDDMAKSASETSEVVLKAEPMKENVSYKCKMVCVREP